MSHQVQLALFDIPLTIDELISKREDQWFDRKSIRIQPRDLADAMIGFANADGGCIAVGIRDGQVEGTSSATDHVNGLLQAAIDFSSPSVRYAYKFVDCLNKRGQPDKVLTFDIPASETIHRNAKNECFLRIGDENRRLGPTEERELAFDKGESWFDGSLVRDLGLDDLDLEPLEDYGRRVGSSDIQNLMRARGLYVDRAERRGVTQAGWLLFGREPPATWSYIRYLRYIGITAETGPRSNLLEDIRLEGTLPQLIEQARELVARKLGTVDRLVSSGKFERISALPEFAWLEAIVNAVTHRSYSLQGDGIRIRHFDDRLEIESPGRLPGLVRVQNIRNTRFSRNPRIARVLAEMGYVRELNEGVKRIYEEMQRYGLPEPQFTATQGGVIVALNMQPESIQPLRLPDLQDIREDLVQMAGLALGSAFDFMVVLRKVDANTAALFLRELAKRKSLSTRDIARSLGVSVPTARIYMRQLQYKGIMIERRKSTTDPGTLWELNPDQATQTPKDT